MSYDRFQRQIRLDAGHAAEAIYTVLRGGWQVEAPFDLDSASFLTVAFQSKMSSDEHFLFRQGLLTLLSKMSEERIDLTDAELATLLHVSHNVSLADNRRRELTTFLSNILELSLKHNNNTTALLVLNFLASERLVYSTDKWRSYFNRIGEAAGYTCFSGIAHLSLPTAVVWLDQNDVGDARNRILNVTIPAFVVNHGYASVVKSLTSVCAYISTVTFDEILTVAADTVGAPHPSADIDFWAPAVGTASPEDPSYPVAELRPDPPKPDWSRHGIPVEADSGQKKGYVSGSVIDLDVESSVGLLCALGARSELPLTLQLLMDPAA